MLKYAIIFKEELEKLWIKVSCDNYYKFFMGSSHRDFTFKLADTDYWQIQRVSVDRYDNLLGYIEVSISRNTGVINGFGVMNFTKKPNIALSKDLLNFLRELRDVYGASKFEFSAYEGGPPAEMYKKFIKKHGGRIVGTYTASTKLMDGKMYDSTMFEIMRKDMNF